MKRVAIVLLIIGLIMTAFTSYNFITREKVVDLGSVEITQNRSHSTSWSPIIGGLLIVVGTGVYLLERNKN